MIRIERHKPVAQLIEEGEALHLGEASEIDIRTLFLHIHHPLETGFHLFQFALLFSRMQNILHRILFRLFDTITRHTERLVLHQIRHNLPLDGLCIMFCIHTEHNLLLKFHQFLTVIFIFQQMMYEIYLFRIDGGNQATIKRQHPTYKCPLTNPFINRFFIHMDERTELCHIEMLQCREHHGTDNQLLVIGIHGRRQEHLLHSRRDAIRPYIRRKNMVKKHIHIVLMLAVQLTPLCLTPLGRL